LGVIFFLDDRLVAVPFSDFISVSKSRPQVRRTWTTQPVLSIVSPFFARPSEKIRKNPKTAFRSA
jgi:hypothetical protein